MLQYLGTDIVRRHDPKFWLKQLAKQNNLIIADIRFPEEKRMGQNNNGILYYIVRNDVPINTHVSEHQFKSLDEFIRISNNGSVEDLENLVNTFIKTGEFYGKI